MAVQERHIGMGGDYAGFEDSPARQTTPGAAVVLVLRHADNKAPGAQPDPGWHLVRRVRVQRAPAHRRLGRHAGTSKQYIRTAIGHRSFHENR
jgi:hypothetical protein